jgi:hypothetical protein
MSLLELVIAVSLGGVLMFGAWALFSDTSDVVQLNVWSLGMDTSIRTIGDRFAEELKDTGEDPGGTEYVTSHPKGESTTINSVEFRRRIAFNGDAADWGTAIKFQLAPYTNENPTNQIDDDGDGVVDEQQLVREQDGAITPIAHDITFLEFRRVQDSAGISFRIDITRRPAVGQDAATRSRGAFIAFRNVANPDL